MIDPEKYSQKKPIPSEWLLNTVVIGVGLITAAAVVAPLIWLYRWALGVL